MEFMQQLMIALAGGAAAGLVGWGVMRTEIKFLWRDLRRLEKRVDMVERRGPVRVVS